MGKKPTPEQVRWQEAARGRLQVVLDRRFDSNQTRLASALGVSHTLVNLVVRAVQPPTRNLMARLGTIEGVNPRWADTGDGEPFVADTRGTLPVSDVLLPGAPADYAALMTGERFAVAPAFDRASCYYWRMPQGHPAPTVDAWRLLVGDLLLLETSRAVVEVPGGLNRKWCVLDGGCLSRTEPVYGAVTADEKSRLMFSDGHARLRFLDPSYSSFVPGNAQVPKEPDQTDKPPPRRRITLEKEYERREAVRNTDPWFKMPAFEMSQVLAVQLLMVRC